MATNRKRKPFRLRPADRRAIELMLKKRLTERERRRLRILVLLVEDLSYSAIGREVGTYLREVRRIRERYEARGLEHALRDEPRGHADRLLDDAGQSALVAMVCGPAPEGRARWTIRLVAEEAVARGIAPSIGRETVRLYLERHELKPWREKNVVRAGDRRGVHRSNGRHSSAVRA